MPRTIVHVEDDENVLKLVAMTLKGLDAEVVSVNDPLAAGRTIREKKPDLIVCDISMPGKNGFEVIREVREGQPPVTAPVIFFSAMGDDMFVKMALELGAVDFVRKPASASEIRSRVKAWLDAPSGENRKQKSTVVRGQLDVLTVADMLRFFDIRRRSGIIKVWVGGTRHGELHVQKSVITGAMDPDGSGEAAARRLLALKSGEIEAVMLEQVDSKGGLSLPVGRLLGEALPPAPPSAPPRS